MIGLFLFLSVLPNYSITSGGTFALYSLLCRHGKFNLLPNQQAADEELSAYKYGPSGKSSLSLALRRFLEKHKSLWQALLFVVLLAAGMVIGDGVISPAMSGMAEMNFSEGIPLSVISPHGGETLFF